MTRPSRAPYIIAGLVAAVPLLVLAAAAPGGHDWVWLEFPRHITIIAIMLGLAVCGARSRQVAIAVPLVTVGIAVGWQMIGEYAALSKLHATEMFGTETGLLFDESGGRLAPWLMGGLYGVLALLAIARARKPHVNRRRAALWLAGVGGLAVLLTLGNDSWLTLENLGQSGTFRSSGGWPDSKVISLVAAGLACVAGIGAAVRDRHEASALPRASVHRS